MANKTGLPGSAEPWGRKVEDRLRGLEHKAGITAGVLDAMGSAVDKTVVSSFELGQNFGNGVSGRGSPAEVTQVQYISSTGMFEVTVSLAGLVQYGAILGAGFESVEWPYEAYFDIPKNGPVASCDPTESRWVPFAQSRSTIITTRPGVFDLGLYFHVNTTQNANSQAFVNKAQLSVKAV